MTTLQLKQARLNAIQDEVKQLHPLLKLLLPKLPRVQHVEDTHGPNEMGADSVFSRLDEIFRDLEYVGVIAKIGKIVQDYTAVERQIRECEIERFFGNGRKKIFLRACAKINSDVGVARWCSSTPVKSREAPS